MEGDSQGNSYGQQESNGLETGAGGVQRNRKLFLQQLIDIVHSDVVVES